LYNPVVSHEADIHGIQCSSKGDADRRGASAGIPAFWLFV
jgi:hypothetical protein